MTKTAGPLGPYVEVSDPNAFVDLVADEPGGEKIRECIQCGVCTGSCTTAEWWEFPPRKIIAMIRAGMKDEVLSSASSFYCVSCYKCTVRCPRGIKPANLIHAVEAIAEREGFKPKTRTLPLYCSLRDGITRGRLWELGVFIRYYTRTNPLKAFGALPTAFALFSHGRLKLTPPRPVKGAHEVRAIMKIVRDMEAKRSGGAR